MSLAWRSARMATQSQVGVGTVPSACGTQTQVSSYKQSRGIRSSVYSVAFSPDGNKIASGEWGQNHPLVERTHRRAATNTHWAYELGQRALRLVPMETKSQAEEEEILTGKSVYGM